MTTKQWTDKNATRTTPEPTREELPPEGGGRSTITIVALIWIPSVIAFLAGYVVGARCW